MTVAAKELSTVEDLERLSAQGFRYELIAGELREMSPVGMMHACITDRFAAYARIHIDEYGLGEGFVGEMGCIIARHPDTALAPDWAFIAAGRLPEPISGKFSPIVPDMVFEARSPNDTQSEVTAKMETWIKAGVKMALEANPKTRLLTVYRPDSEPYVLGIEDELSGEDVLPGFTLSLRKLFRENAKAKGAAE